MEILIYYGAIFLFYVLINVAIYGSALFFVRRYLKSGKSKFYLLIWPAILIGLNLYALIGLPVILKSEFDIFDSGVVYERANGIETVYLDGLSDCHKICGELLLEGHVKRVIADDSQSTLSYYEKSDNPDCLIDNLTGVYAGDNAIHFYQERCVQQFRVFRWNANEFLNRAVNRNNSVSIREGSFFSSGLPVSPQFGFTKFTNGTWIFHEDQNGKTKTLSIVGKLVPERPMTPLIVEEFRSSFPSEIKAGWLNSRNFDIFMTTELYFDARLLSDSYSDEKRELNEQAEIARRKLIQDTIGIELDGTILDVNNLPTVEVVKLTIREIFDGYENWPRSSGTPPIYEFAKLYKEYPFVDVFLEYNDHPVDWVSKQARSYTKEAWCYHNSNVCKRIKQCETNSNRQCKLFNIEPQNNTLIVSTSVGEKPQSALSIKVKKGVYDFEGNVILPMNYEHIWFYDNLIVAENADGKTLFNMDGSVNDLVDHFCTDYILSDADNVNEPLLISLKSTDPAGNKLADFINRDIAINDVMYIELISNQLARGFKTDIDMRGGEECAYKLADDIYETDGTLVKDIILGGPETICRDGLILMKTRLKFIAIKSSADCIQE